MRWLVLPPWFPRFTRRGGVSLILSVTLAVTAITANLPDLFFVACVLFSVPLIALVYVLIRPGRVRVTRSFLPAVVPAGAEVLVSLQLRNLSARPLEESSWREGAAARPNASAGEAQRRRVLPSLDRHRIGSETGPDSVRLEYRVRPGVRGIYPVGPLLLSRKDPFGFAVREHPLGQSNDLIVTPRVMPLPTSQVSSTRDDGSVRDRLRSLNPMSDELIAREYRSGDPMRRVNWPATARHGQLMVRQEEHRSNPEARIVLDTTLSGRPAGSEVRDRRMETAFELAITLVASLGAHLLDAGLKLQLVETGPSQLLPGIGQTRGGLNGDGPFTCHSSGGDRELLEGLANVVPVAPANAVEVVSSQSGSSGGGQTPTFAVLVAISAADATQLAGIRNQCQPAIAFVLSTMSPESLTILRAGGWLCIEVRNERDISAAWDNALARREGGTDDLH